MAAPEVRAASPSVAAATVAGAGRRASGAAQAPQTIATTAQRQAIGMARRILPLRQTELCWTTTMTFHDLTVSTIDLAPQPLSAYAGKVLLVVNTASECGHTPHYTGLEALHERFASRGFSVLGFPSNDFGKQEPGSEADIKAFCSTRYHVTFPMFAKVKTMGADAWRVYRFMTSAHDAPKWNFHKYLVGKDGRVIRAFGDGVQPDDPALVAAVESALAAPAP